MTLEQVLEKMSVDEFFKSDRPSIEPKVSVILRIEVDGIEMVDETFHYKNKFIAQNTNWSEKTNKLIDEADRIFLSPSFAY